MNDIREKEEEKEIEKKKEENEREIRGKNLIMEWYELMVENRRIKKATE